MMQLSASMQVSASSLADADDIEARLISPPLAFSAAISWAHTPWFWCCANPLSLAKFALVQYLHQIFSSMFVHKPDQFVRESMSGGALLFVGPSLRLRGSGQKKGGRSKTSYPFFIIPHVSNNLGPGWLKLSGVYTAILCTAHIVQPAWLPLNDNCT